MIYVTAVLHSHKTHARNQRRIKVHNCYAQNINDFLNIGSETLRRKFNIEHISDARVYMSKYIETRGDVFFYKHFFIYFNICIIPRRDYGSTFSRKATPNYR